MRFVDEFRDPVLAQHLLKQIRIAAKNKWVLMDVCGGQTHSLLRYGIEDALSESVELIHGPGCPVCVTSVESIDFAQHLASRPEVILASFGDMLRVPGGRESLLACRARGGNVHIVYSPLDAVVLARKHPDSQIVFFAVGFETTAPATALAILQARQLRLRNFSVLVSHVRVLPAMEALMSAPANRVQAFLAAGHVCTIGGFDVYDAFVEKFRVPVVVTGFEPLDLLQGILCSVQQLENGKCLVENCYARGVRQQGNELAQGWLEQVYEVADCSWRGFGIIAGGGLRLRPELSEFNAELRFSRPSPLPIVESDVCWSGQVMAGTVKPPQCPQFASRCTPDHPLGAPMVSSEGACAAYMRYHAR